MKTTSIARSADRLRLTVWIFWGCLAATYLAGRFGLAPEFLKVKASDSGGETGLSLTSDASVVLLSIAILQLNKMLCAIAQGDLFSARVVGAFRAFAFWLLLVAVASILLPVVMVLIAGPGPDHQLEFKLQMRDLLTLGLALILFLVARLLERARTIDEEMREIV